MDEMFFAENEMMGRSSQRSFFNATFGKGLESYGVP